MHPSFSCPCTAAPEHELALLLLVEPPGVMSLHCWSSQGMVAAGVRIFLRRQQHQRWRLLSRDTVPNQELMAIGIRGLLRQQQHLRLRLLIRDAGPIES